MNYIKRQSNQESVPLPFTDLSPFLSARYAVELEWQVAASVVWVPIYPHCRIQPREDIRLIKLYLSLDGH